MAYMKHPTEGNRHVAESEVPALQAQGWVKWPRSLSEKQGNSPPNAVTVAPEASEPATSGASDAGQHTPAPALQKRKPGRPKKA